MVTHLIKLTFWIHIHLNLIQTYMNSKFTPVSFLEFVYHRSVGSYSVLIMYHQCVINIECFSSVIFLRLTLKVSSTGALFMEAEQVC